MRPLLSASARRLESLCEPGGADLFIRLGTGWSAAIEIFRDQPKLRLLPILDDADRPVGGLFEQDVRKILYNPYGHALLSNPSFARQLEPRVRDCPAVDIETPLAELIEASLGAEEGEGMILTAGGRLIGVLSNRTLVYLAAEREREIARARLERFDRVTAAGALFLRDIRDLTDTLSGMADRVEDAAGGTVERSHSYARQIASVAAASQQMTESILGLAAQGSGLAETIGQVNRDSAAARQVAGEAVSLAEHRAERDTSLRDAVNDIDSTSALIQSIANQARMLAINAAIEAARLGHDGGGFAVVARELRQFSAQTRDAAAEIGVRVRHIRTLSTEILTDHEGVERMVKMIDGLSGSVDAAVAAQAATARILSENVNNTLQASGEINDSVAGITTLVAQAAQGAGDLRATAGGLSAEATRLRDRVAGFVQDMTDVA